MIGKLNYINGLFLGKEELNRQQTFLNNSLASLIRTSGIRGLYPLSERYNVTFDDNTLTFSGEEGILGIDSSQQVIYYDRERSISLSSYVSTEVYLGIKANLINSEQGTVSLSSTGVLTGVGTRFLDVLRGSYTKKGSKIYFPSVDKSYLVESITNNTTAKLIGPIDSELTNVEWAVMGTFSPFVTSVVESTLPYTYYSYELELSTTLPNETSVFVIGRISWTGTTPSFEFIQNKNSILGNNTNVGSFDYIVDSDESLRLLRSNSQATNVLIKSGVYTYTSSDGKGLVLHPNTKLLWAEGGSFIKIFSSTPSVTGSFAIGYNNLPSFDVQAYNLNVENNSFPVGIKNMQNLTNCRVTYTNTSISFGFNLCNRLTNCSAYSVNTIGNGFNTCNYLDSCWAEGYSTGYVECRSVSRCHAECSAGYSTSFASRRNELTYVCTDSADGGFNSALGEVPAPPVSNYNRIYLSVEIGSYGEAILVVNSEYNVASGIVFEVLVVNSIGKEEVVNISLLIGENYKEKSTESIPDPTGNYSISSVIPSLTSDATYTYQINY